MMIGFKWSYFLWCIAIALALCAAQIMGSGILVIMCCAAFLILAFTGCIHDFTLPVVLFFLLWSPILRVSQDSFSFYTVGLVMIAALNVVKNWYRFKRYHLVAGILLLMITLLSKLIGGSYLALDYLCFIMMITIFPTFIEENAAKKYDFYGAAVFFSAGIILAALCAQQFAAYGNIARFIRVDAYSTIVRRCGFYGDPNFYTAQITAAMGGCLVMILRERAKGRTAVLGCLLLVLLYCGFLSGSKSFLLVSGLIALLWGIDLVKLRGRGRLKAMLILSGALAAVYIATSSLFSGLIDVVVTRFASATDMDSLTSGRMALWKNYLDAILGDWKTLLLGKGFTDVTVNGRASHNTAIQIIFQFGLIGTPVLAGWLVHFWRNLKNPESTKKTGKISTLILMTGAFLPWMAIDALFFDEFFLLQWYCFMGVQALQMQRQSEGFANDECRIKGLES